ncbi:hypothetical protein ACWD4J_00450 [Streptomyces sp. NPDC002577]
MRYRPVIAVVDRAVLAQGDRDPHRAAVGLGGHLHPLEYVVAGHAQLDDAGAQFAGGDAEHCERVPQPVARGGDIKGVLTGAELEP